MLKFVSGIPYRLKVRTGFTTSQGASQGAVAFYAGDERVGECTATMDCPPAIEWLIPVHGHTLKRVDQECQISAKKKMPLCTTH